MTTAYIVQIDLEKGTRYLGPRREIRTTPKFFISSLAVKGYIGNIHHAFSYGDSYYSAKQHAPHTRVIVITELEKGLKQLKAEILFYEQFMERDFKKSSSSIPNNPKAVYKIQLADKSLVILGSYGSKFGKAWSTAGHLRAHISRKLKSNHRLFTSRYEDARVVEIEHDDDGINTLSVKYYPIKEFYEAAASSAGHMQRIRAIELANIPAEEKYA